MSYGTFEDMAANLETTLSASPYLTGDTFTAADMLVGGAVNFAVNVFKLLPATPALSGFIQRTIGRPSFARAMAREQA